MKRCKFSPSWKVLKMAEVRPVTGSGREFLSRRFKGAGIEEEGSRCGRGLR